MEILIPVLIVLTVIFFALIGFFRSLKWLFFVPKEKPRPSPPKPTLSADVQATGRLIAYLRKNKKIGDVAYQRIRQFLEQEFPGQIKAPGQSQVSPEKPRPATVDSKASPRKVASQQQLKSAPQSKVPADREPIHPVAASNAEIPGSVDDSIEVVEAVLVEPGNAPEANAGRTQDLGPHEIGQPVASAAPATKTRPAPWDLPDPPAPVPRRSFAELMSGFMQEKNMRWGELTSGILIVLSAVGLVVSLRDQLRDTIPYFSSLLFLLITAAIQAAGIYTLKKWKLRNTSRGTLVIGLLLIPLNFVAACILSGSEADRRPLSDPWLWAAVSLGLASFSAMTWWSSKNLLRRGNWPMLVAIMGCGVATLLLNRLVESTNSGLLNLVYMLPVAASFLVGTCLFDSRQWVRSRWTERATNRLFLFLGVSTFAVMASLSIVIMRADSRLSGLVAITPMASIVCLIGSWLGSIVHNGSEGKSKVSFRFTGQTLEILGLALLAISLAVSISKPTIFVVNAMVVAFGLMAMFVHQQKLKWLPIAWAVFACGVLAALNLATGNLRLDAWASSNQLRSAILNGQSGLCLLVVGVAVVGIHMALQKGWSDANARKSFVLSGWIAGGAVFLIGCLIALIASLVNRGNVFDVMTASSLLLLAAIGSSVVCVFLVRIGSRFLEYLPHVTSVLWFGGLIHCLIWNPGLADAFSSLTSNVGAGWVAVAVIHGLIMAGMGTLMLWFSMGSASKNAAVSFGFWAAATSGIGLVIVFFLVPFQSGWAAFFSVVASVAWFLNSWVFYRAGDWKQRDTASAVFILSTAIVFVVLTAEIISRFAWCPTFESPNHWIIQLIGLSIWSIAWTVLGAKLETVPRFNWLFKHKPRVDLILLFGVVFFMGVFVCGQVGRGAARELVWNFGPGGPLLFHGDPSWMFFALSAIGMAVIATIVTKPTLFNGAALVCVWMLAWALGADFFDASKSTGSAVRWLLPVGGVIAAILVSIRAVAIPLWVAGRNRIGLAGPSSWNDRSTQRLINLALAIVCFVVLLISSITVSRVLLHGGQSLGGPAPGSWFRWLSYEVSFGVPIAIVVSTFLLYAISERRSWLATVGSAVFQYVVLLAIVLLFLSPHPKLASTWFVGILQAVSLGMSAYGFVWLWKRDRIGEGTNPESTKINESDTGKRSGFMVAWPAQIEIHTLINGLLITSLAVLAMGRFYFVPDQPGDWISSVGSWLGLTAWALFGGLAVCIWWQNLVKLRSTVTWLWLCGWMGLMLTGLIAAVIDQIYTQPEDFVPWLPFKVVTIGAIVVASIQSVWAGWFGHLQASTNRVVDDSVSYASGNANSSTAAVAWPLLLSCSIGLTFAFRGAWYDPAAFWLYVFLMGVIVVLITTVGMSLRSVSLGFVACAVSVVCITVVFWKDPQNWFSGAQPYWFNLVTIVLSLLALAWTAFYLQRKRVHGEQVQPRFVLMPNVVLLVGVVWVFVAALLQLPADSGAFGTASTLANPLGVGAFVLITGLAGVTLWNDWGRFKVVSWCLLSLSAVIVLISAFSTTDSWRYVCVNLGAAMVVCAWGLAWLRRKRFAKLAKQFGVTKLAALERSAQIQLPIYSMIVSGLVMWAALLAISFVDTRPHRYLAAVTPFALAVGLGCQSNLGMRRWLQILTLVLSTLGGLFLAWADLTPDEMFQSPMLSLLVRSLIVLAGAMFVYGGLVTRWVRPGDTWLNSLRQMAVATCGLAMFCFAMVIFAEQGSFQEGVGCGLALGESIVVALLVLGMVVGLVSIAVRPKNDPFALSLQGRTGYVYAAELVTAALVAHLYFTMPWLFQFGIKAYWPYIAMAICFGGVGMAHILEQRNLKVLGQPLFHTAAILPVIVSAAVFGIDSKADASMVMLIVGMVYLMISYTRHSVLSAAAAVVFGNLALWIFINRFPGFSFFEHPQFWLIPPAVSALIAGQLSRRTLTNSQLATLRYICVAIIYVSSTSEIFISGIGEQLWPPMVLATLAVIGIMSGIMLQVKSFLYFGSLFLLMAMITMVSLAHQRLNHVWPWWAFGIGLGVAILVMFGLFEKRKNDMKAIAEGLREWDA